jgi:hypothetical protein
MIAIFVIDFATDDRYNRAYCDCACDYMERADCEYRGTSLMETPSRGSPFPSFPLPLFCSHGAIVIVTIVTVVIVSIVILIIVGGRDDRDLCDRFRHR